MASQRKSPMDHPVVVTFLILAVIGAMSLAAEVLKPLALAVLLSFALAPLAGFFERRRVPRADRGHPHGRPRARVPERDRLRRRAAALRAGLPTAGLSEGNPEEGGLPEALRRHLRSIGRRKSPATWPSRSTRRSSRGTRRWTCGSSSSPRSGSASREPSGPTWNSSASAFSCSSWSCSFS